MHKESAPVKEGEYAVILSPQYYWVKKTALPVKRVGDARKLAASVFEGSLPAGEYSYEVARSEDGEFILIAYDRAAISEALAEKFTDAAKVRSVHFAQDACAALQECCTVDEKSSLVNLNGLLMQIPRNCTDPKLDIETFLKDLNPTARKVKLGSLDMEVIDRRTVVALGVVFALFLSALGIEYVDYKAASSDLEKARAALIRKYDLPPTTMQLASIRSRLFKTYKEQKKMRDALYDISKLPLQKSEYIKTLAFDDKSGTLEIALHDPAREAAIKAALSKKHKILQSRINDNILQLKIAV